MEKKRIITIGREFGSGGRTIGKEVADRLGIPCYDHELIDRLAEESGLSKEYITNESEYASHSSWTAAAFSSVRSFGVPSNQDYLWAIQRRIILELGQKENCVIVGRCADPFSKAAPIFSRCSSMPTLKSAPSASWKNTARPRSRPKSVCATRTSAARSIISSTPISNGAT